MPVETANQDPQGSLLQAGHPRATGPRATGWKLHTPNALVAVRLVAAAITIAYLSTWTPDRPEVLSGCAVLFVFAALTDALDGYLARKWNAITTFGRIMDPVADKILVLGTIVVMAGPVFTEWLQPTWFLVPAPKGADVDFDPTNLPQLDPYGIPGAGFTPLMAVVIVSRELLVTSMRAAAEADGLDFSATAVGKAKMIAQSVGIPLILLIMAEMYMTGAADTGRGDVSPVAMVVSPIAWAITLITAWSAFPYLFNAWDGYTGGRYFPKPQNATERIKHSAARALTVHGFGLMKPFPGTWGSLPPVLLAAVLIFGTGAMPTLFFDVAVDYGYLDEGEPVNYALNWLAAAVYFLPELALYYLPLTALCLWGCWACLAKGHVAEAIFNKKDPGPVVADEVAGMCITLIALPIGYANPWYINVTWLVGAFVAFRIFDIIKLPPANQLQKLPGGAGILVDDLFAGLYALITLQVIAYFI